MTATVSPRKEKKSVSTARLLHAPRLLLVESQPAVRRRVARLLKQTSADILIDQAGTVAEAIRRIDSLRPGTLLLDLELPDGSGLEVLRHAMTADARCMVIVLTDRMDAASRLQCFEEGADFVFTKSDTLDRALDLARRASRREPGRMPRQPLSRRVLTAQLTLANRSGLHALPAAHLVRLVSRFGARLTISCNGRTADAKNILEVIALGAECGTVIAVAAEGGDAGQALAAIRSLVASRFHEPPEKRARKPRASGGPAKRTSR